MKDRRMATPHYRQSETNGWLSMMGVSFIVGCMCGAAIALAVV